MFNSKLMKDALFLFLGFYYVLFLYTINSLSCFFRVLPLVNTLIFMKLTRAKKPQEVSFLCGVDSSCLSDFPVAIMKLGNLQRLY